MGAILPQPRWGVRIEKAIRGRSCAFQVNSAVRVVAPILLPPMRVRAFMARSDERAHLGVDVQGDATDVVNRTSPDG